METESGIAERSAPTGSQAIDRAHAVLECFMQPEPELGVTEIARRLGLSVSTVHRIVRAHVHGGYLEQNTKTGGYYLGRTALMLGQYAQRASGLDLALRVLEEIAESTGESVNLAILDGDAAIIALRVETKHPLRFSQPVGIRVGLYCSATGKALLAFHPDGAAAVRRLGPMVRLTDHTIVSLAALERDLDMIRERGFSLDEQETQLGVRCIGAPVLNGEGHAHKALAVQIPTVRMPESRLAELGPLVVAAAQRLAEILPADRPV